MIDELASEMGFSFSMVPDTVFSPFNPVNVVLQGGSDVGFNDMSDPLAFTSRMSVEDVMCTPGVVDSRNAALVLRTRKPRSLWGLFAPIAPELWFMIVGTVLVAAVAMILVNTLAPPESAGMGMRALNSQEALKALYHVLAALLNGEDYEWVTWPGRVLRLGLLFFVLVVIATYTANLAAFFTRPEFIIHGPQDLVALQSAKVCAITPAAEKLLKPYVGSIVFAPSGNNSLGNWEQSKAECYAMLQDKEAEAWIDDVGVLTSFLMDHCDDLHLVPSISILLSQPSFCLRRENTTLARQLSSALAHLKLQPSYQSILREHFGLGRSLSCQEESEDSDTVAVPLDSMWGLFIITGSFYLAALLLACVLGVKHHLRKSCTDGRHNELSHTATEGEMLRMLLQKVDELGKARPPVPYSAHI